ncbi:hypothetical protein Aple_056180 [Acrocarpospora pleiomorpha]|uniref:DUF11 domain-containing protein n=1 Tax=Acrocarpospora pleiomorpha TaxID=90975 RepID=A0A5M3XRW9_9ACTN|nr:hypothetical protein Aple_056180 [Acrocarpospora pleiomorpha]
MLVGLAVGLVLPASASREAQLTVRVTDNRTYVAPSATVSFTVTVINEGGEKAKAIDTRLELGAGLIVSSASDGGSAGGGSASWPKFSLAGGAERVFQVVARVPDQATAGFRYESRAMATAQGTIADATDETFVGAPQLAVSQTDRVQEAVRGETLTYTITVSNPGTLALGQVHLVESAGSGLQFESATRGGAWNETHRQVSWPGFELPAGAEEKFIMTAKVPADAKSGQVLRTTASVTAVGLSDQAVDETLVTVATGLALSKSDDRADAKPGEELTYTITVRNTGEVNEPSVALVDRFGERLEFVSVSGDGTYADREVRWPEFPVKAGERRVFSVVARVLKKGERDLVRNEVIATTPNGRRSSAEDTTVIITPPPPPPPPKPTPTPKPGPPALKIAIEDDEDIDQAPPKVRVQVKEDTPTEINWCDDQGRPVAQAGLGTDEGQPVKGEPCVPREHPVHIPDQIDHPIPVDRVDHPGRGDHFDRPDHFDHPDRFDHPDHGDDFDQPDHGPTCCDTGPSCCDTAGPLLPQTGTIMIPVLGAGVILLTLGGVILLITRRRRRNI